MSGAHRPAGAGGRRSGGSCAPLPETEPRGHLPRRCGDCSGGASATRSRATRCPACARATAPSPSAPPTDRPAPPPASSPPQTRQAPPLARPGSPLPRLNSPTPCPARVLIGGRGLLAGPHWPPPDTPLRPSLRALGGSAPAPPARERGAIEAAGAQPLPYKAGRRGPRGQAAPRGAGRGRCLCGPLGPPGPRTRVGGWAPRWASQAGPPGTGLSTETRGPTQGFRPRQLQLEACSPAYDMGLRGSPVRKPQSCLFPFLLFSRDTCCPSPPGRLCAARECPILGQEISSESEVPAAAPVYAQDSSQAREPGEGSRGSWRAEPEKGPCVLLSVRTGFPDSSGTKDEQAHPTNTNVVLVPVPSTQPLWLLLLHKTGSS
ncbi:translation initiation factor IF-2-like [Camelus ferus]|uniref:Translation initiation factor IF-2-like n=1 Tax=Camelus ferus TaxID=419612 RepID=A0A8B8STK4_CAMFR|nr:translation initiation factor IF-2-like [Camelus ferus]